MWRGAPRADARELRTVKSRDERIPLTLVARYACAIARAIGGSPNRSAEADAEKALVALGDAARQRGLLDGIVLTARPNDLYKERMYAKKSPVEVMSISDEQVAVALLTVVSCSPPLVLRGREPSLSMLRSDKALRVARLRAFGASPDAERVWAELQICSVVAES
jgi:hypothetical protein